MNKGNEALEKCADAVKAIESLPSYGMNVDEGLLVDAWINRAEAYMILGDYDNAVSDFQKAREKQSNNRSVLEGLNRAQKALKMAKRKDYYKILDVARDAQVAEIKRQFRKKALGIDFIKKMSLLLRMPS